MLGTAKEPYPHTPFVQPGAEESDTGVEAVEPDPGSSWEGHSGCVCVPVSGIKVQSLVGLSAHSAFHSWSAHWAASYVVSEKLISCFAAGTNGCLDLRRRAATPDGRVSTEWSGCPGSMAWVLEIVWLLCDEAQQVGYLQRLNGCLLVYDAGIQSQFARRC